MNPPFRTKEDYYGSWITRSGEVITINAQTEIVWDNKGYHFTDPDQDLWTREREAKI